MKPKFTAIVAMDRNRGIGLNNALPWNIPEDLKHFKEETSGRTIIMGRKTFESIGRPLPNRRNIVLTRQPSLNVEGVEIISSLYEASLLLRYASTPVFIIGGAQVYDSALSNEMVQKVIVTHVDDTFECDTFFPELPFTHWAASAPRRLTDNSNVVTYTRYA